jgi:hypothetical protein
VLYLGAIKEASAGESLEFGECLREAIKAKNVSARWTCGFSEASVLIACALAADFSANVGPEFFHHEGKPVVGHLSAHTLAALPRVLSFSG